MNALLRTAIVLIAAVALYASSIAAGTDPRDALQQRKIDSVRINLNPAGGSLGFETEIAGSDSRLAALIELIRVAQPGGGHKCPNAGAIRFRMQDGTVLGVGLLPSHSPETYGFRLYDDGRLIDAYRVDRTALLAVLSALGVPTSDPAFRE